MNRAVESAAHLGAGVVMVCGAAFIGLVLSALVAVAGFALKGVFHVLTGGV